MPKRVVRGFTVTDGVAKEVDFVFEDDMHCRPRVAFQGKFFDFVEDANDGPVRKICRRLLHRLREYLS